MSTQEGCTALLNQSYAVDQCCYNANDSFIKPSIDWVHDCLARIAVAFRWPKSAVIGPHRLFLSGSLGPANRDQNSRLLRQFLREIVRRWPEVEFMGSNELGDTMHAET